MNIFSRGSKKRKKFVEEKRKKTKSTTDQKQTEWEAQEEYMQKKKEWADELIEGFNLFCELLRHPVKYWDLNTSGKSGSEIFWLIQNVANSRINKIMNQDQYKNVAEGGNSSKYLQQVQFEMAKLMSTNYDYCTDTKNFKSSMESCGKGLSKLKHPIGSTALVKVTGKSKRVVDCVDELAELLLDKTVQEEAADLVKLPKKTAMN